MPDAAGRIIELYRRHADAWIARRGRGELFEQPWLDRFLALLPPRPAILDLGCGSGAPIANYFILRGATLTGVDTSAPLLDHARARHASPHRWIEADMRGLDLGETFDGVLAWHSAFHLTGKDQRAMFEVYARHVRPQGALMFTGGPQSGVSIGQWKGEPLYHASLDPDEYDRLLDAHGFDGLDRALRDPQTGHASIWLARRRS